MAVQWVLDEVSDRAGPVVEALVELGARATGGPRAEIAEIAISFAVETTELLRARAASLLPAATRALKAREALATCTDLVAVGAWIAGLPDAEQDGAIAPYVERARLLPAFASETIPLGAWDLLRDLTSHLSPPRAAAVLRDQFLRRARAPDFDATEIYRMPDPDREVLQIAIAREQNAPSVYAGWRLGDWARGLPPSERGPVLDSALDAFARIAATPTSPGNDAGPFCELAALLDQPRVERALAIIDDMARTPWGLDLERARSTLAHRLAVLDAVDRAEVVRDAIVDPGERAWAYGAIVGARIVRERIGWSAVQPVELFAPPDVESFLHGVRAAFGAATPPADVVVGCLALATTPDDADIVAEWTTARANRSLADRVHAVGGDDALVAAARSLVARDARRAEAAENR